MPFPHHSRLNCEIYDSPGGSAEATASFADKENADEKAQATAAYFADYTTHQSHSLGITHEPARVLEVSQSNVSQVEHTDVPYISTLRDYVEALGGRLEIRAVFPDRIVSLAVPVVERQQDDERLPGLQ